MAILFDLDGTLLDTSHDIHAIVNQFLDEQDLQPMEYLTLRNRISQGSEHILSDVIDSPDKHLSRLVELSLENGFQRTKLFPGVDKLLNSIEQMGLKWGIVTNRIEKLTMPLLEKTGLLDRSACVVCGDTTLAQKPHSAPILHACNILNIDPAKCVYIGDAITDIQAGSAAGMPTIAAGFGFIDTSIPINNWEATHVVSHADEILPWIEEWSRPAV